MRIYIIILLAVIPLTGAYISQYVYDYHPCILCIYQRVPYFIIAGLGIMWLLVIKRFVRVLLVLSAILFAIDGGIAVYHTGVEQGVFEGTDGCVMGSAGESIEDLRAAIFNAPIVQCSDIAFLFMGLSMAAWNIIYGFGAGFMALLLMRKKKTALD